MSLTEVRKPPKLDEVRARLQAEAEQLAEARERHEEARVRLNARRRRSRRILLDYRAMAVAAIIGLVSFTGIYTYSLWAKYNLPTYPDGMTAEEYQAQVDADYAYFGSMTAEEYNAHFREGERPML